MTYAYENLSPEKFQQFCQALLVRQFPYLQCFPVGQPDGGRDAISWLRNTAIESDNGSFIVHQVKFHRRAQTVTDPHKWLLEKINSEIEKIRKLIPKGAREYYLITNISGTSHLDKGSIDKLNDILKQNIPIPTTCWWRDDLDRRLDLENSLKWSYPELLSGKDLLGIIFESSNKEDKERRTIAISTYVAEQYKEEEEVRFKQIELQNKLFDLFIDIPLNISRKNIKQDDDYVGQDIIRHLTTSSIHENFIERSEEQVFTAFTTTYNIRRWHTDYRRSPSVGAATALLNSFVQSKFPKCVIEGAPGQGKSTIVQYVCQVHRLRLLDKDYDINSIPTEHRSAKLRLPFKVDLRDLATWFDQKNPFSAKPESIEPNKWRASLEAFICAQVEHHSGGIDFSVPDLHAIAKDSAILIVLDGFDEVADIKMRENIVDEIMKAVNRLQSQANSLQVIITSRPAAFAKSPGFPRNEFPHFELGSVTREQVENYAEKWIKARKLQGRESTEFKSILHQKIDEPHIRELARNPMQLAILLSLIHTRGSSLPDKRTALYDNYIELFLSRESGKSEVVREHRDLLIDLHRYLAWILHRAMHESW